MTSLAVSLPLSFNIWTRGKPKPGPNEEGHALPIIRKSLRQLLGDSSRGPDDDDSKENVN